MPINYTVPNVTEIPLINGTVGRVVGTLESLRDVGNPAKVGNPLGWKVGEATVTRIVTRSPALRSPQLLVNPLVTLRMSSPRIGITLTLIKEMSDEPDQAIVALADLDATIHQLPSCHNLMVLLAAGKISNISSKICPLYTNGVLRRNCST
jgi:hypothetical protein